MASFTVAAGAIAVHRKTLTASTVDTVTFTDDLEHVEVISDGIADLFVTVDGSTPTVDGDNTRRLPAGAVASLGLPVSVSKQAGEVAVKLISPGTPVYSVQRG